MQDTELVMKYHGLGPQGVKAMSDPLEVRINLNGYRARIYYTHRFAVSISSEILAAVQVFNATRVLFSVLVSLDMFHTCRCIIIYMLIL